MSRRTQWPHYRGSPDDNGRACSLAPDANRRGPPLKEENGTCGTHPTDRRRSVRRPPSPHSPDRTFNRRSLLIWPTPSVQWQPSPYRKDGRTEPRLKTNVAFELGSITGAEATLLTSPDGAVHNSYPGLQAVWTHRTSGSPNRPRQQIFWRGKEAIPTISADSGKRFEPRIVDALLAPLEEEIE